MNIFIALKGSHFLFLFLFLSHNDKCPCLSSSSLTYLSRLMTKTTKWHVRPAKTRISQHLPSLIRVLAVRMKNVSADAEADLSLRWARMPFCWFCHKAAHFMTFFFIRSLVLLYFMTETLNLTRLYLYHVCIDHVTLIKYKYLP